MNKEQMMEKAMQVLKEDDEIFVRCVDELDSWSGYADGFRCYEMCELDDLHCGMSLHDFLEKLTDDFKINDEYFYYSIYGLESTNDKIALYRDNVWESDLLEILIDLYTHLDLEWIDSEFAELIESISEYEEEEEEEEENNPFVEVAEVVASATGQPEIVTA